MLQQLTGLEMSLRLWMGCQAQFAWQPGNPFQDRNPRVESPMNQAIDGLNSPTSATTFRKPHKPRKIRSC